MKYTSAQAAKLLRQLSDTHDSLLRKEERSCEFVASLGEDIESVRPQYDFAKVQKDVDALEKSIRILKHAINVFNTTHTVPDFDMTVDQMLIYIPQLTKKREKLYEMTNRLPKSRENAAGYGKSGAIIDYNYANYDIEAAVEEYNSTSKLLAQAQTALDLLNSTEVMEIEL